MCSGLFDAAGRMPGTCRQVLFPAVPPRSASNPTLRSRYSVPSDTTPQGSCNGDSLSDYVPLDVLVGMCESRNSVLTRRFRRKTPGQ